MCILIQYVQKYTVNCMHGQLKKWDGYGVSYIKECELYKFNVFLKDSLIVIDSFVVLFNVHVLYNI